MTQALLVDCMDYMDGLADNHFSLAIVDPPYGIGEAKRIRKTNRVVQDNGHVSILPDRPYKSKSWDDHRPSREYFDEVRRVSCNQIIWGGNHFADLLPPSSGWVVWDKVNGPNHFSDCELAWTSFDRGVRQLEYMWNGMQQGVSISRGRHQQGNKRLNEKRIHPTQKPVKLYQWLLMNYAQEGDTILDTHMGSGSSRIAADMMGFTYVGCEIDQEYFDLHRERFESYEVGKGFFRTE